LPYSEFNGFLVGLRSRYVNPGRENKMTWAQEFFQDRYHELDPLQPVPAEETLEFDGSV
jgi:hypothetical protein